MNISEILAQSKAATEFMYDKKAIISRHVPVTKPNGADGMEWRVLHALVPCRLSSVTLNNTTQEDVNKIAYDVKLFLSPLYEILAGDEILVGTEVDGKLIGAEKFMSAREPFIYVSHQEVLLKREGYA